MKKKRRIENRIIAVILCMAILFSQVNIADAADLNPSGTNTSQVALSDETNMSNDEASTESTVSDEINGTIESESKIFRSLWFIRFAFGRIDSQFSLASHYFMNIFLYKKRTTSIVLFCSTYSY